MAAYITSAELLTALANALQVADENSLSVGTVTLANAVKYAYNEIIDRMTKRGFPISQIDSWDRRVEFNTQIGLWHCFAVGGVPAGGDQSWVKNFDQRKDLDTVGLFINNVRQWPASAGNDDPGGSIGGGVLDMSVNAPTVQPITWNGPQPCQW